MMKDKLWACKVKYDKQMPDDSIKKVTEEVLVESESYTESEARVTEIVRQFIETEFSLKDIRPTKYAEYVRHEGEELFPWWLVIICLAHFDEEKKKEKIHNIQIVVQASDVKEALAIIEAKFNDGTVISIELTKIINIYPYDDSGYVEQHLVINENDRLLSTYGKEAYECYMRFCEYEKNSKNRGYIDIMRDQINHYVAITDKSILDAGFYHRNTYANHIGEESNLYVGLAVKMTEENNNQK